MLSLIHRTKGSNFICQVNVLVEVAKESEKAVQFFLIDQPKITFWMPKSALTTERDDDGDIWAFVIKHWFNPSDFIRNAMVDYGNVHRV